VVDEVLGEELVRDDRPGALRLQAVLSDPPRSLNLLLLLRLACELAATAIVVTYVLRRTEGTWPVVAAVAGMTVVSYVFVGVAPRTIGRQQAEGVVNRQGERINHLESQIEELGRRLESQADQIAALRMERDEARAQLPTSEDIDALQGMMNLLSQKRGGGSPAAAEKQPAMRIVAEAA